MPSYRSGEYESRRKPLGYDEQVRKNWYEPEWDGNEEDMREERKLDMRPYPCKFLFPFMVEVRVIPCDDNKHPVHW